MGSEPGKSWDGGASLRAENFKAQLEQLSLHIEMLKQEVSSRPAPKLTTEMIKALMKARRIREEFFGQDLFADPAWDMLLDAYAARLQQKQVSVTGLSYAAGVPKTTALRWITALECKGLLQRRSDPLDGRRSWIELTVRGVDAMERYWEEVSTSVLPI